MQNAIIGVDCLGYTDNLSFYTSEGTWNFLKSMDSMPFKSFELPQYIIKKDYRYNLNSQHQLNHVKRELRAKQRDFDTPIKIGYLENLVLARRFSK